MKTSITFLKSNYDFFKTIDLINDTNADFIHVDVMDGIFVNNRTPFNKKMLDYLKNSKKKKDVHLMTLHLKKFIDVFSFIEPEYITYQFESTTNHDEIIDYIKSKKIKVGIAISPLTNLEEITPYLNRIDLVLIMAVIPGYGGQKFIESTPSRVKELKEYKKDNKMKFKISIDGGINEETIQKFKGGKPDIVVSGSYICCSNNYNERINKLKENKKISN